MHPGGDGFDIRDGGPATATSTPTAPACTCSAPRTPASPARACRRTGSPPTTRSTAGAWTASCSTGTPTPCATGTARTCPSTTRWPRPSRSATAGSPRRPCQTYPNRLYLQAATCQSLIATDLRQAARPAPPGRRHDLGQAQRLRHLVARLRVGPARHRAVPEDLHGQRRATSRTFNDFLVDCHAGTLPSVSIVSPGVNAYTEENPPRHPARRGLQLVDHQRRHAEPGLAEDGAVLHVRRARRLLRPRGSAGRHPARRHPARRRRRARTRRRRGPSTAYGCPPTSSRRSPSRTTCQPRDARPHVGPALHRDEVQPRRAHPPRRQRRRPARLPRLPAPAGVPRAAHAGRPGVAGRRQPVHARHPAATHRSRRSTVRRPRSRTRPRSGP